MLVFASICPHSPILIPNIGKDNLENLHKTQEALLKLNKRLKELKPDTIIVLTPHGKFIEDTFTIPSANTYRADYKCFGDIITKQEYKVDNDLIHKIYDQSKSEVNIKITNTNELDYGSAIPLFYLNKDIDAEVISIGHSYSNYENHFHFGEVLKDILIESDKRIAIVASGDLSHCLNQNSPGKYFDQAKSFDQGLIETLKNKKNDQLFGLDPEIIEQVGECSLHSIMILLGIIGKMNYEPEFLSYESPFGVGYLVMDFKLLN